MVFCTSLDTSSSSRDTDGFWPSSLRNATTIGCRGSTAPVRSIRANASAGSIVATYWIRTCILWEGNILRPCSAISKSKFSASVFPIVDVPRQLFLPVPVASLKNVTEISALGTTFNQRQFPQQMFVPRSFTGYRVDQFTGHDTPPLLHPPLQSAPVGPVKPVRIS